jgi:hypothetical protein
VGVIYRGFGLGRRCPVHLVDYAAVSALDKTLQELLLWLYLKNFDRIPGGTNGVVEKGVPGLSASTISRLKDSWKDEHRSW